MSRAVGRKFPKSRDPELERRLQERQIITVRCAFCNWARTGPAFRTSQRGNEAGMLAAQARHREHCKVLYDRRYRKENREHIQERSRAWQAEHVDETRAYMKRYYAENRERINERRRVRDRERRARAREEAA